MTDKNPELEKLIHPDLLQHSGTNPPRPPSHDPILDLLAAQPPEGLGMPKTDTSDALNHPADVLTSAEPPAIFRPGNTGIMSPDPTFPGIAPPNIPTPLPNPAQLKATIPSTGDMSAFGLPSISATGDTPAAPLSSLPTLDPALFSTQPFLPPPDESPASTAALATNPATSDSSAPPSQSVPNSVRDILPLLPDAAPSASAGNAAPWRQTPGAAAEPPHPAAVAASGSAPNGMFAGRAARPSPGVTVSLGDGHVMAKRVLAAMNGRVEDAARELCKTEIHRSFGAFRAGMRANFR